MLRTRACGDARLRIMAFSEGNNGDFPRVVRFNGHFSLSAGQARRDAREARDAGAGAQRSADALAETANIEIVEDGGLGCGSG